MKSLKVLIIWCVAFVTGGSIACAQMGTLQGSVIYSTADEIAITDTVHLFHIKDIIIDGNNRTKPYIVLREVSFKKGQDYPLNELVGQFAETKKQLLNTGLFHDVVVSLQSLQGYDAYVKIDVKERWYLFPIPFIRTVDRSFGEWITQQHMDLRRVNYGIKVTDNNITGRNDRLYVYLMNGYTKQVAVNYNGLFLDKKLKWSANMGVAYGKNKELNYKTVDNKLLAVKNSNDFVHSFFQSFLEVSYRRAINTKHTFGIRYNHEEVADTVYKLNPSFATQRRIIRYPELTYKMTYFNVDYIPYPTKGYASEIMVNKRGFNHQMNLWQLIAKGSGYWPMSHKYFFNLGVAGSLKLPFDQPYISQQLLGYNDMYMQGYEYFVVDGVAGGYAKATLSKQILNTAIRIPSERFKRLNYIPVRLYAKVYGNAGYVYNRQPGDNLLCNKLLYSGGVGLDLLTFYDFIIKVEWSFNQLGQNGLYLHRKSYF